MKNILIVNSNTYASKTGGGTVADITEANDLVDGAFAAFTDAGVLIPASPTSEDLAGVKEIIFAVGVSTGGSNISVPVPLKTIMTHNKKSYVAYTKPVTAIGVGGNASLRLTIDANDVGDATIRVYDKSFTSQYPGDSTIASVYKRSSMTITQTVDALVAKLNKPDSIVVATKTGSGDDLGITVTPKHTGVTISVAVGGLLEYTPVYSDGSNGSVVAVYGVGQGVDVIQIEKDIMVFKGDGGYNYNSSDWFKVPTQTTVSAQYTMYNLLWQGIHDTPTTIKAVMTNQLIFAIISTGSNIVAFLDSLFDIIDGTTIIEQLTDLDDRVTDLETAE